MAAFIQKQCKRVYKNMRTIMMLLVTSLLSLAVALPGVSDTYTNATYGFTLTIPDGWVEIPYLELSQVQDAMLNSEGKQLVSYIAGFQREGEPWFAYPYILVQPLPYPRQPTNSEMKELVASMAGVDLNSIIENNATSEAQEFMGNVSVGRPIFDSNQRKYTIPVSMDAIGIGAVDGKLNGFFGRRVAMQVMCYHLRDEVKDSSGEMDRIADSFEFYPASAYSLDASELPFMQRIGAKALLGMVVGVVVVIVVFVSRKLTGK